MSLEFEAPVAMVDGFIQGLFLHTCFQLPGPVNSNNLCKAG
jgi:hypothetical protein